MECIEIIGGRPLQGRVRIQGSKNAALPILAGAVLHSGRTVVENCPDITDVWCTIRILKELGCRVCFSGGRLEIDSREVDRWGISGGLGSRMRSSVIFLGSLLGRLGRAQIPFPGGCTIGKRPVDLHKMAFEAMGASVCEKDGFLCARGGRLKGADISFPFPSVGATENAVLGAVLADGQTRIHHAAREPEVEELCRFLRGKGARISWNGEDCLVIEGVSALEDSSYTLTADRIVAGTYLFGAVATRGNLTLEEAPVHQMKAVLDTAAAMGTQLESTEEGLRADASRAWKNPGKVATAPYPGFPTDLQSPLVAAASLAEGRTEVVETIFESRFQPVSQLQKMGADIVTRNSRALITGVKELKGADLTATDLRGAAALILAGAAARGVTRISGIEYVCRGYENIVRDLRLLGARVRLL
ncbi:MAG TPA: UDP-N-acetylglucosamine 1-carboxyvinyltransferase [Candidatus Limivivens intestinipullorum]|uniref:UDP-N-acetylglucosamine 1-carboxyvinyltransferase n=1 Tax=Candidatus Limivivens intestinipullorum TaxID=2840858 RepID=A0A9D1JLW3_9FIRM|nr:UDP-N-acetylglucosamine 1-carboxyvinyltransferase [Candidatus Limivivens intestinipullorum]